MPDRPPDELRCPTCGARQARSDTCRRCKCDLRLLVAALESYDDHRRAGLADLDAGRLEMALGHARRCHELRPGPESSRLLALCRLLRGDWPEALAAAGRANDAKG
jgi:hypothetical protein